MFFSNLNDDVLYIILSHLNLKDSLIAREVSNMLYRIHSSKQILTSPCYGKVHTLFEIYDKSFYIAKTGNIIYKGMRRFETFSFQIGSFDDPVILLKANYPQLVVNFSDTVLQQLNTFIKSIEFQMYSENIFLDQCIYLTQATRFWDRHGAVLNPWECILNKDTPKKMMVIVEPFFQLNILKMKADHVFLINPLTI